jgi:hypothetical protein
MSGQNLNKRNFDVDVEPTIVAAFASQAKRNTRQSPIR